MMEETALRDPYPSVQNGDILSYGGCQSWLEGETAQKSGCGLVAATDLLLYLHRHREGCSARFFRGLPEQGPVPVEVYRHCARRLQKKYFPLAKSFGLNAFVLALGMARFFRDYQIPLHPRWGVPGRRFWQDIRQMLENNIPVILCVGINFPLPWGKEELALYTREPDGAYRKAVSTRAHYVAVTAMDSRWLRVASWGREYYIRREEYDRYRREHSCGLYSNLLYL